MSTIPFTLDNAVLTAKNALPNGKSIQVTGRALQKIREAMEKEDVSPAEGGLRLGVEGGGCSGLSYNIRFDAKAHEHDRIYEFDGVRLLVDPKSFIYLYGMILDYERSQAKQGFNIIDPNSKKSCGCGASFPA